MSIIERFKRDIARHPGRAGVLGVLFVTLVVFGVKGFFELNRVPVVAAPVTDAKPAQAARPVLNSADSEARVNESTRLWRQLREVKANAASTTLAFAFDSSLYPSPPPDPRRIAVAPTPEPEPLRINTQPTINPEIAKENRIRAEARQLVVKTIAIGNESTPSMAIINQQLVTVGQSVLGFELTAIRPREVVVVKEGVSQVVKMAEGL